MIQINIVQPAWQQVSYANIKFNCTCQSGQKPRAMSLSLEDIRSLLRRSKALPANVSETEIKHYASEVLRRLRHGEDIEKLSLYLRRLTTSTSRQSQDSVPTDELAEQALALFNNAR